jgi:aspartyl-tRNA(Asn)/glutamyl-tRNA(Gln) amidotransferase subunit B
LLSKPAEGRQYEAVIGLEVHAELSTHSKMFCSCPVVESVDAPPNSAVCPVCSGMPGVLPVPNKTAVEYALRVSLALNCNIAPVSIFARKNYFYPDLPKGYQISQYEQPLAKNGSLCILTSGGEKDIRVRRVHIEEDTGKLTHVQDNSENFTLIDLNRAGVPLLEIVSEPDLRTPEEVREYAAMLRAVLKYLGVNSGDMQKGVLRIEPNVSVRKVGSDELNTRTEIKNLNSFRALEQSVAYEIERQVSLHRSHRPVEQQTLGWDERSQTTQPQRSKEEAHDYRYFPDPDIPPLRITSEWIEQVSAELPELPLRRYQRFQEMYTLPPYDARVLTAEPDVADYFEASVQAGPGISPKTFANWISGELFSRMNQTGENIAAQKVSPVDLAELLKLVDEGAINQNTAKSVLDEIYRTGNPPRQIIKEQDLQQVSDSEQIANLVREVLQENPDQVREYLAGKDSLSNWFFGQVMKLAKGRANPQIVQEELKKQLGDL